MRFGQGAVCNRDRLERRARDRGVRERRARGPLQRAEPWRDVRQRRLGPAHRLLVVSEAQGKKFEIGQEGDGPGIGYVYIILDFRSHGGVAGATVATLPAFGSRPAPLAFQAHARGLWGDGQPLVMDAELSLTRIAAEAVTYAEMKSLTDYGALDEFIGTGAEHTRRVDDWFDETTCTPEGSGFAANECSYSVRYTLTEFVETARIANYGVRDLVFGKPEFCCYHCDLPGFDGACNAGFRRLCFPVE
jgi:hypothetical protein